ncbi:M1 family metallopeptidase [Neobacillus sp. D3-1R]|uniref:M1 family metallopeptidase n=1 Tax=Neobacillus sp. D3-1R TaxID=3445778 RepID=UPI003FA007C5
MFRPYLIYISLLFILGGCVQNQVSTKVNENEKSSKNQIIVTPNQEITFKKAISRKIDLIRKDKSITNFKPEFTNTENKAVYDLTIKLSGDDTFYVTSNIEVRNLSKNSWEDIIFYLIPNAFTEKWKPKSDYYTDTSEVEVEKVAINGEKADFKLANDTLQILLKKPLSPNQMAHASIQYKFKLPENGNRFSHANGNFYLAQWYPMLATYRSGWDKDDYSYGGETYHTGFGEFTLHYEIPGEYNLISSSENENIKQTDTLKFEIDQNKEFYPYYPSQKGILKLKNSKEIFLAIIKDMKVRSKVIDGIEVRVFSHPSDEPYIDETLELAVDSLQFFNKQLGGYPYNQLDVIMDEGGMEYPGIVTVGKGGFSEHTTVHEIAHQWFYGIVSNSPFQNTWIDEGFTDFATHLYFLEQKGRSEKEVFGFAIDRIKEDEINKKIKPAHLPVNEYITGGFSSANYKVPTLKLWDLSEHDTKKALAFLKTYVNIYAYQEVDAQEWFRFIQTYFHIEDPSILTEWIKVDESS